MAPLITEISQLKPLVRATGLLIQDAWDIEDRRLGLLFECAWEPEHGLAVKFENEVIEEVGFQDVVL